MLDQHQFNDRGGDIFPSDARRRHDAPGPLGVCAHVINGQRLSEPSARRTGSSQQRSSSPNAHRHGWDMVKDCTECMRFCVHVCVVTMHPSGGVNVTARHGMTGLIRTSAGTAGGLHDSATTRSTFRNALCGPACRVLWGLGERNPRLPD